MASLKDILEEIYKANKSSMVNKMTTHVIWYLIRLISLITREIYEIDNYENDIFDDV